VGQRECLGIVGESGSGKTTLIRSVVGLLDRNVRVAGGAIGVHGHEVVSVDRNQAAAVRGKQVGFIFQDSTRSLNPLLKVRTQLKEVLDRHRPELSKAEAQRVMEDVLERMLINDVPRVLGAYPHELSGGMCQRIAIAIALVADPALLLADECTTALDVTTQAEVVLLLRELVSGSSVGLAFVTHDLALAADLCDRIAVMRRGEIVELRPTAELLRDPREQYTRDLLAAVPAWAELEPERTA
ncbi:MAG: ABC transporter ATP-binding protein, partial [Patulibacter sp.]|nr:ABC transporter ATP-binding protein [Patulibacter sp.]